MIQEDTRSASQILVFKVVYPWGAVNSDFEFDGLLMGIIQEFEADGDGFLGVGLTISVKWQGRIAVWGVRAIRPPA